MSWEADRFIVPAAAEEKASVKPDEPDLDRERRHAARRFFRRAPPYCIEFDADGTPCGAKTSMNTGRTSSPRRRPRGAPSRATKPLPCAARATARTRR
jgi:hypothetical protein